jgi:RNA polymerase sigma factor (sigma-70 family)
VPSFFLYFWLYHVIFRPEFNRIQKFEELFSKTQTLLFGRFLISFQGFLQFISFKPENHLPFYPTVHMAFSISIFQKTEERKLLSDKQAFYDALGRAEPAAIRALAGKIAYDVKQAALHAALSAEDAEELINDAVMITITNVQNQTFLYSDFSPAAYAKGVARKLIANRIRTKKPKQEQLEDNGMTSDYDPEDYVNNKELELLVGKLLGKLEENCRQLLRLKYFENLRDKEIVEQNLTSYSSTTSLKSKRNQCMNKLIEIAKETGLLDDI